MVQPRAGQGAVQIALRLPPEMRDQIKLYAEANGRSINSEIVNRLTRTLDEDQYHTDMIEADKYRAENEEKQPQHQKQTPVRGGIYNRPPGMSDEQLSKLLEATLTKSHKLAHDLFIEELTKLGGSYTSIEELNKEADDDTPTKADKDPA